jgi:hypothetical protein
LYLSGHENLLERITIPIIIPPNEKAEVVTPRTEKNAITAHEVPLGHRVETVEKTVHIVAPLPPEILYTKSP